MKQIDFRPNIVLDEKTGLYGIIYLGIEVVKPYYDTIIFCSHGIYITIKLGKYGLLNSYFKEIIPCEYEIIHTIGYDFSVCLNKKYAIFKSNGFKSTEFKYDDIYYICYNAFYVEINGLCGIINQFGNEIIPIRFTREKIFESVQNKQKIKNILNIK